MKKISFAGGCFWGVQHYFTLVRGVYKTKVGYTGGNLKSPTYQDVCSGETGHTEACLLEFDINETKIKYLLEHFLNIVDTYTLNKQGNDVGTQYRSGIYYYDDLSKNEIFDFFEVNKKKFSNPFVTEILPAQKFWEAEEYHQEYLDKHPYGYCHINPIKYRNVEDYDKLIRGREKI